MSIIGNNYSSLFSSMSGGYNAAADFSSIISQRSQIKSGSYGKLMKAYVNKVGNKTALDAYRKTGTTANANDIVSTKDAADKNKKKGFLDNHLANIGKTSSSTTTSSSSASSESKSSTSTTTTGTTTKKTGFLDNHLASIGKKQTSSTTSSGKSYLDGYLKDKDTTQMSGVERAKAQAEAATGRRLNDDGTTSVIDTTV